MTSPLTDQQLDEIEARASAATPGPWGVYESGTLIDIAADLEDTGCGYRARREIARLEDEPLDNDPTHREWTAEEDWAQVQADAAHIAGMSPEVARALVAEVRRLRAELERRTEDVAFLERATLPELRRQIEHHKDGKQRWRERAETAEARVTELEGPAVGPDSLPAWLYSRFINALDAPAWSLLTDVDRAYWEHQARAVRRAVERGGFKAVAPDAAPEAPAAPLGASPASGVSESAQSPTGAPTGPRRTLTPNEYDAAWHAVEGAAGEEGADPGTVLHAVLDRLGIEWQGAAQPATSHPATEDLAAADNPTMLRWGLNDVLWSDDDSVIVLLSGPDREPYWLELDPERAAVLRGDLAGPDGAPSPERDALIAELLPAWEAMYEPGNVSDYLIGYANSEAGAKGAAEAWLRSQAEVTGRLEWERWGADASLPDGYDALFELIQRHDDGIDTGPGIAVRRRVQPTT